MLSRGATASGTVLALLGFSLCACAFFRLHVGSWLRGARSSQVERMSGAMRVLMEADEDHPLVFEEAMWRDSEMRAMPGESTAVRLLSEAPDRYTWKLQNPGAGFSRRYAHAAVLNTKQDIFVIGGATADISAGGGNGYLNDVWVSEDHGRSWERVTPRTPKFTPRRGHAAVMNANQIVMFVLGGFCGKDCFMNDWWSSENGDVWQKLGAAPWSARHGHAAVVTSKENLILMGGHDGTNYLNDIWSMQDPEQAMTYSSWVQVQKGSLTDGSDDKSLFSPRYGHAVVINTQDVMFVMGGFYADKKAGKVFCFHDVWRSDDEGNTWKLVTSHAPWTGRYQHASLVTDEDHVFIIGGLNVDLERCSDVWRTKDDGVTWDEVTPAAPWEARYEHASVIDRNSSLYVIGGMSTGADKFHDVWRSERTCADDVECPGEDVICRDGTHENFHGLPNPICVFICDRRIFDNCKGKEACRVKHGKAVCVDPCSEQACDGEGEVCEVYPRNAILHDVKLDDAEAYCLACGDSRTKFACDKLRQCIWSTGAEACLMRCKVASDEDKCKSIGDSCSWSGGKCENA
jgi:photosystem II stability/assembly factor-like uncharacterized protein